MPDRRLARILLLAGAVAAVTAVPLCAVYGARYQPAAALWVAPFAAAYAGGAVAFRLRPDDLAARRLLAFGSVALIWITGCYGLALAYAGLGDGAWLVPANTAVQLLDLTMPACIVALLTIYPDGRYQRPYERRIVRAAFVLAVTVPPLLLVAGERLQPAAILGWSEGPLGQPDVASPLHLDAASWLRAPLALYAEGAIALLTPIAGLLLLARYRRFPREQRVQIGWPLYGGILLALATVADPAYHAGLIPMFAADLLEVAVLVAAPALLAIGIVRPALIDIERVARRSLVYALLWGCIAAAYVGVATALGIAAGSSSVQLAVLVTVAATLLFQPIWRYLVRVASSTVYGERLAGEELVRRIGAALEHTLDLDELARTVAATVREGLGVRWVRITVDSDAEALAGAGPVPGERPECSADLDYRGERLGRIDCGPRLHGRLGDGDRTLLAALGRQAALAVRNARLASELSDRLDVIGRQADDLAASRARLVEAEERARRQIERDIHDGVQQELVALIARIGLARKQLGRSPELLDSTLADLQSEARQALADLRELASGIHPSVLGDSGIVDAIESRAARLPLGVTIECDRALRGTRFPEAVEGAAYFVVCEGFANALKHSGAERVVVRLACDDGTLELEIADDGRGFDTRTAGRSGLDGLADRVAALGGTLEVRSAPGAGTALSVCLPAHERVLA